MIKFLLKQRGFSVPLKLLRHQTNVQNNFYEILIFESAKTTQGRTLGRKNHFLQLKAQQNGWKIAHCRKTH